MKTEKEIRERIEELKDELPPIDGCSIYLDRYDGPRRELEALEWILEE